MFSKWIKKDEEKKHVGAGGYQYPMEFNSMEEWGDSEIPYEFRGGPSPGGAASDLRVSRQVIWLWSKQGLLDRITIAKEPRRRFEIEMVSRASIDRVCFILEQLRAEWDTSGVQGRNVAGELKKRLPQLDMFEDFKPGQK